MTQEVTPDTHILVASLSMNENVSGFSVYYSPAFRFSSSQSQGKDNKKAQAQECKTWNEEAMERALESVLFVLDMQQSSTMYQSKSIRHTAKCY